MIVKEKRQLVELRSEENLQTVRVAEDVDCCFAREPLMHSRLILGTIEATCATNKYILGAHLYMKKGRLVYKKINSERNKG